MPDYDTGVVNEFTEKLRGLGAPDLVQVWFKLCGWWGMKDDTLSDKQWELVDEFQALSLWNQQGVLYQLVPLITELARTVAHKAAAKARKEDPL